MENITKAVGEFFLGVAETITNVGSASMQYIGTEDMPESMKNAR